MKKYIFCFVFLLTISAQSSVTTSQAVNTVDQWFPTPQSILKFMAVARPSDAQDMKEFMKNSHINPDQKFPAIQVEGNQLLVSGLSTPIIMNTDGSFSFKSERIQYNRDLSFKKNMEIFDKHWGQFKEFGSWGRHSRFDLFIPQAFAEDVACTGRCVYLKPVIYTAFLPFIVLMSGSAKDKAASIDCGNPPTLFKGRLPVAEVVKTASSQVTMKCSSTGPQMPLNPAGLDGQIYDLQKDAAGAITKVTFHKDQPIELSAEEVTFCEKAVQTLLTVCAQKSEKKFNQDAIDAADYIALQNVKKLNNTVNELLSPPQSGVQ